MHELLSKRLGVKATKQALLVGEKATGTSIKAVLDNLLTTMGKTDKLYLYYAGHGSPGIKEGEQNVYFIPRDAPRGNFNDEALSFKSVVSDIRKSQVGQVVMFLDTCFSGTGQDPVSGQINYLAEGTAPVFVEKKFSLPSKVTVYYGGKGDQYANEYKKKGHRLFGYYLAEGIVGGKRDKASLEQYLHQRVRKASLEQHGLGTGGSGVTYLQEPFTAGNLKQLW